MLTALKSGDYPSGRLMFQPDAKDVAGRVHIPVVGRSAVAAFPASYSKRAHTFRAAGGDRPAARARLGTVSLVSLDIHRLPSGSFVPQHVAERTPPRIKHGLCNPCFGETGGVHIANDDQRILTRNPGRLLVLVVPSRVGNFCMDGANPLLVAGALRYGKFCFISPVVVECRDFVAIGQGSKVFQTEVDTDRAVTSGKIVSDFALKNYIPATSRIFNKVTEAVLAIDFAAFPKPKSPLEIYSRVPVKLSCARYERNPPQSALTTKTSAKRRAFSLGVSACGELPANLPDRVGVQPKVSGDTRCQFNQIEGCREADALVAFPPTLCFKLRRDAEVPYLVAGDGVAAEMPVPALNSILEAKDRHACSVKDLPSFFKMSAA